MTLTFVGFGFLVAAIIGLVLSQFAKEPLAKYRAQTASGYLSILAIAVMLSSLL